jgi:transposase
MATRQSSPADRPPYPGGTVTSLPGATLHTWNVAALPIINYFLEKLDLEALLGKHLPRHDGRSRLSVARGLILLVQNLLISREPLYGLGAWAERHDPGWLGLTADALRGLNDDRLGRCLDALFQADRPTLLLELTRQAVQVFQLRLDELHNDSTTISFSGDYAGASSETHRRGAFAPAITWGHSKDHRPDLKQLLYILTLTQDGGVPLFCRVASGNVTDDRTHCDNWDILCQLVGHKNFLYVADCKLATRESMHYIASRHGRFVSVLPRTRREDTDFRERLERGEARWQQLWDKLDDDGRVSDRFSTLETPEILPEGYRLWWFHSTCKVLLDRQARRNRIERAERHLQQLRERLGSPRSRLRERARVQERVQAILDEYELADLLRVDIVEQTHETFRQRGRGRPGQDTEYIRHVRVSPDVTWTLDESALARIQHTDGVFPLVTNDVSLSALEVLHAYKHQPVIEKRFEQLKTDFVVAPVWLKDVGRIDALLHVYFIVLLVQALLERHVRQAMARAGMESMPLYAEGRPCRQPTTRRLLDLFEPVQRHTLEPVDGVATTSVTELTPVQRTVLRLLGLPTMGYGR